MFRKLKDVKRWFQHRLHPSYRYHIVNTGLKPNYYDIDTRMLHACFSLLVEYVETELPSMSSDKNLSPREAGLQHLDWAINYNNNIEADAHEWDRMNESQVNAAKITKELYLWWKDEYPTYEDLECESSPDISALGLEVFKESWRKTHVEEYAAWRDWCDRTNELEAQHNAKEQEMLHKLMEIRQSLWT